MTWKQHETLALGYYWICIGSKIERKNKLNPMEKSKPQSNQIAIQKLTSNQISKPRTQKPKEEVEVEEEESVVASHWFSPFFKKNIFFGFLFNFGPSFAGKFVFLLIGTASEPYSLLEKVFHTPLYYSYTRPLTVSFTQWMIDRRMRRRVVASLFTL